MPTPISASGYYLTMENDQHHKYYVAIVAERFTLTAWGRIGSAGQHSLARMATIGDAEAVSRRQAYAKAAKGYTMHNEALKFTTDFDELMKGNHAQAVRDFTTAREATPYAAQADVLARDYEDFERLLEDVRSKIDGWSTAETMMADMDGLKAEWQRICDAHERAKAMLNLVQNAMVDKLVHSS